VFIASDLSDVSVTLSCSVYLFLLLIKFDPKTKLNKINPNTSLWISVLFMLKKRGSSNIQIFNGQINVLTVSSLILKGLRPARIWRENSSSLNHENLSVCFKFYTIWNYLIFHRNTLNIMVVIIIYIKYMKLKTYLIYDFENIFIFFSFLDFFVKLFDQF
jgi:hypothetical protein